MSSSKLNYLLLGIAATIGADIGNIFVNSCYDNGKEVLKKQQTYIQILQNSSASCKKQDTSHSNKSSSH